MSQMWTRTLVYLGLREEPEEMYDELPARFVPEDDPYAEHAPARPNVADEPARSRPAMSGTRQMAGAAAAGSAGAVRAARQAPAPRTTTRDHEPVLRLDDDPRLVDQRPRGVDDARDAAPDRDTRGRAQAATTVADDGVSNVRPLRVGENLRVAPERSPRVAVVEVERFDDVEAVGARYRTGQPVLFDVVADAAVARRVVDFVAGLTYASHGSMTKVGARAFLLVPDRIEVDDDERRRLRELGYRVD